MKTDNLPEPMVPAEVDLRGLEYMPLLGAKLFESDFNLEASDAEFRRALLLWWKAWNQQPAGSLPDNERAQAKLAGFEDEKSTGWRKVRARVLHGFTLCSDGRLYHPVLAAQALIAWEMRSEKRAAKEHDKDRQRRVRTERKRLFADLKEAGQVPAYDINMPALRALHAEFCPPKHHAPVTVTVAVIDTVVNRRDVTGLNTEGPASASSQADARAADAAGGDDIGDGRPAPPPEEPPAPARAKAARTPAAPAGPPAPPPLPPAPPPRSLAAEPAAVKPEAALGMALKRGGLDPTRFNTSDPRFTALVKLGVEPQEAEQVAREAAEGKKGFPWVCATLIGRRQDAAAMTQGAPPGSARPAPQANTATGRRVGILAKLTGKDRPREDHRSRPDDVIDVDAHVAE